MAKNKPEFATLKKVNLVALYTKKDFKKLKNGQKCTQKRIQKSAKSDTLVTSTQNRKNRE